jgi:hypothetical protein
MGSVDDTQKWIFSDSDQFWKLARKIEEKQLWAGYLSEQEHSIWRKALRGQDSWKAFLNGHGEPIEIGESQDGGELVNGATKSDDNGEKIVDPVTTAFRARVMLFESAVRKLFPPATGDDPMDSDVDDALEIIAHKPDPAMEEKPKTRDIEEDNYDDEEEEKDIGPVPILEPSNRDADSSMDQIGNRFSTALC